MTRKPGDAVKMQENPDLATERLGEKTKPKERNAATIKAMFFTTELTENTEKIFKLRVRPYRGVEVSR